MGRGGHWTVELAQHPSSDGFRFSVNKRIFVVGFGLYGSIHGPTDYQVNIQVPLASRPTPPHPTASLSVEGLLVFPPRWHECAGVWGTQDDASPLLPLACVAQVTGRTPPLQGLEVGLSPGGPAGGHRGRGPRVSCAWLLAHRSSTQTATRSWARMTQASAVTAPPAPSESCSRSRWRCCPMSTTRPAPRSRCARPQP